ncbi:oxidoreductase [Novosphingobium piscinae]|uniref:Oxidoreductase n=1 Tax=Novosphingobium piscinae TaxID=1507448 RepID=A0A7X1G139_9SPHN|nr:oxidoreductase [Novosphingobium piscinae]MBC2670730.1 oxidoreductase [Novosphingobium piscinae]
MTDIGVGLIGYGLGGRAFHAPFIAHTPGLTLRAVVSRDAAKVRADWPDLAVESSVEALLARGDIGLVVVSSPDHCHADHACQALAAGCHVVVDKPFALTLAEARRVVAAADAGKRQLSVFHNRRWDADFLTLRALVAAGRLGRIVHFESRFDRWRPTPAEVWKEARSGGSWQDLGPHLVDQALQLFGRPTAVTGDLAVLRDGAPAPDWFQATLHYPRLRATLHSSKLAADHGLRFAVHGTGGSWIKHGLDPQEGASLAGRPLDAPDWGTDPRPGQFTPADPAAPPLPLPAPRGDYGAFWRGLVTALRAGGPNPVPVDEALAVMEVLDAVRRSAAESRTVAL